MTFTLSGRSAQEVSAFRPPCRIIAGVTTEQTCRQLNMSWGVSTLMINDEKNLDDLFEKGLKKVVKAGLLQTGDMVVLTAGVPIGVSGSTNFIKVMHA